MDVICSNAALVHLLEEKIENHPEDTLPFQKVYPHEFIPGTTTETKKFINFDIRADLDLQNSTLKDMTIWFWVICHEYVVPYFESGRRYCWYDRAVCELDNAFYGHDILGIGKIYLSSNAPYYPQEKFKGRQLIFKVKDFSNGLKYGK